MKDKEKYQNAMYTISQYMFTRNEYTPSLNEAVDAIEFIDELVDEYFELVEHIDLIASCLEDRLEEDNENN